MDEELGGGADEVCAWPADASAATEKMPTTADFLTRGEYHHSTESIVADLPPQASAVEKKADARRITLERSGRFARPVDNPVPLPPRPADAYKPLDLPA